MTSIKKLFTHLFIAAPFLLFSIQLVAQPVSKPYYQFKTLTTADGLLSNSVHCVYKDSRGFLWIGTDRGLQRYNGSSFLNFRHLNTDSNSIVNEGVGSITEDSRQNIWICTSGGITKFDYRNGRLTNFNYGYKNGKPIKLNEVLSFFEDSKNRKWVGTNGSGLYLLDELKQQFNHIAAASSFNMKENFFHAVFKIDETAQHELVLSVVDGIVIMNNNGNQEYMRVPEPVNEKTGYMPCTLLPLLKEYPDEIWVSSLCNGFFKYNRSSKHWTNYHLPDQEKGAYISSTFSWSADEWSLGFGNFCLYNHRTGIFTYPFEAEKIRDINNIYRDDEGNIWMPSSYSGLFFFNASTQLFAAAQTIPGWRQNRLMYFDSSRETIYSMDSYFNSGLVDLNITDNRVRHDSIAAFIPFKKVANSFIISRISNQLIC